MNGQLQSATSVYFAPYFSDGLMIGLGVLALLLLALSIYHNRVGFWGRIICAAAFMFLLANPSVIDQKRIPTKDVAAIVIDQSASQDFLNRKDLAQNAETYLQERLQEFDNLEIRTAHTTAGASSTEIFTALDDLLADIPEQRRAGVVIVTDGQIHDVPAMKDRFDDYGPVHVLLTGKKNEIDRRIEIIEAPAYGLVGDNVTIQYKVVDSGTGDHNEYATVVTKMNDGNPAMDLVPPDTVRTATVKIEHAGQNIFDIQVSPLEQEITTVNNRMPIVINGVRDRLRVLLVSGQPHAGGRTWRNLLTSDPGVDLVHFTILREPEKMDMTPQSELSLIAFPFRELFEIKLYDFDLIIFDRYRLNRILPNYYFENIAKYVRDGGALLEVSGPSFAGEDSIYSTALGDVLPAFPTGQVFEDHYKPKVTEVGHRHPVTQGLNWGGTEDGWGEWLRQIGLHAGSGNTIMSGYNDQPLLILDRVGDGRIAHLGSDQIWLWSRGYEGGGPHAELLRRLSHWLMKEPALEEEYLMASAYNKTVRVERRSLQNEPIDATITGPAGFEQTITLTPNKRGTLSAEYTVESAGVYGVSDGTQKRFVIVGDISTPEFTNVVTTPDAMAPVTTASNGSIKWLSDDTQPTVKMVRASGRYGQDASWIGLRRNGSFDVAQVTDRPVLPLWIFAALMMVLVTGCWWFEGRRRN